MATLSLYLASAASKILWSMLHISFDDCTAHMTTSLELLLGLYFEIARKKGVYMVEATGEGISNADHQTTITKCSRMSPRTAQPSNRVPQMRIVG